jgi:hypothetical protein
VAGGVLRVTPYAAARALLAWAEDNWSTVDGSELGVDLLALPLHRFCAKVHVVAAERMGEDALRKQLDAIVNPPTPETWGTTDDAVASHAAAMSLFGAAAPKGGDGQSQT